MFTLLLIFWLMRFRKQWKVCSVFFSAQNLKPGCKEADVRIVLCVMQGELHLQRSTFYFVHISVFQPLHLSRLVYFRFFKFESIRHVLSAYQEERRYVLKNLVLSYSFQKCLFQKLGVCAAPCYSSSKSNLSTKSVPSSHALQVLSRSICVSHVFLLCRGEWLRRIQTDHGLRIILFCCRTLRHLPWKLQPEQTFSFCKLQLLFHLKRPETACFHRFLSDIHAVLKKKKRRASCCIHVRFPKDKPVQQFIWWHTDSFTKHIS